MHAALSAALIVLVAEDRRAGAAAHPQRKTLPAQAKACPMQPRQGGQCNQTLGSCGHCSVCRGTYTTPSAWIYPLKGAIRQGWGRRIARAKRAAPPAVDPDVPAGILAGFEGRRLMAPR